VRLGDIVGRRDVSRETKGERDRNNPGGPEPMGDNKGQVVNTRSSIVDEGKKKR